MKKLLLVLLIIGLLCNSAFAATSLFPVPCPQFNDGNGAPYAGGTLTFYNAGTTTLKAIYTDTTGITAQSNPFTLDSAGRACNVWLSGYYKVVLKDINGVTVWTQDNISSMASTTLALSEWVAQGGVFTYVGATQFSTTGDVRTTFPQYRRVQAVVSAGTIYGTVSTSTYNAGTGLTTVTVTWDSTQLDSGLSAIAVGILNATPTSYPSNIGGSPLYYQLWN